MDMLKRWWLLAPIVALAACGGGDGGVWDEFAPRTAAAADLAGQSFVFREFRNGAVFDPSWSGTPATLSFGASTRTGAVDLLPFSLAAAGGTSTGTATLEGATLRLDVIWVDPDHPFDVAEDLDFEVTSDVDDGRIQLRNLETGEAQASAPR
jgi:hypothetical protein